MLRVGSNFLGPNPRMTWLVWVQVGFMETYGSHNCVSKSGSENQPCQNSRPSLNFLAIHFWYRIMRPKFKWHLYPKKKKFKWLMKCYETHWVWAYLEWLWNQTWTVIPNPKPTHPRTNPTGRQWSARIQVRVQEVGLDKVGKMEQKNINPKQTWSIF